MRNKTIYILSILLLLCLNIKAQKQSFADSTSINKEAENPNFIHAYILVSSEGESIQSAFGHVAIRMVCESKGLDYCFTFDTDFDRSSLLTQFRRKAKAGFEAIPTAKYINIYKKEGRGIASFEMNLTPKEKQKLWKFLDKQVANGLSWTFDYIEVNCVSMTLFAINSAIAPGEIHFRKMPPVVYEDLNTWIDVITENSPWIRIIAHLGLKDVDGAKVAPQDLLTPNMLKQVIPYAYVKRPEAKDRNLLTGNNTSLSTMVYIDRPAWFSPCKLMICMFLAITLSILLYIKKKSNF